MGFESLGIFGENRMGSEDLGFFFQGNVLVIEDLGIYYSRIESPIYPPLRSLKLELI